MGNHRDNLYNCASITIDHSDLPGRLDLGRATARSITLDHHLKGRSEERADVAHNGLRWFCSGHLPQPKLLGALSRDQTIQNSEDLEPSDQVDNVQRLELQPVRVVDGLDGTADYGFERVGAERGYRGVESACSLSLRAQWAFPSSRVALSRVRSA